MNNKYKKLIIWIKREIFGMKPIFDVSNSEGEFKLDYSDCKPYRKAMKHKRDKENQQIINFITKVSKYFGNKYTYQELMSADKGKAEAIHIIGDLKETYPFNWYALKKADIFKRAALYNTKENKTAITRVILGTKITEWIKTPVYLKKPLKLPNFPDHPPTKRIIMLSVFNLKQLFFVRNYSRKIKGVPVKKQRAFINSNLAGHAQIDLPVLQIRDAAGMDSMFFHQKSTYEQLKSVDDSINDEIITLQKTKEQTMRTKLTRAELKGRGWKQSLYNFVKKDMAEIKRDKRRIDTIKATQGKSQFWSSQNIFITILLIFFIITTIVGFSS